MEIQRKTIEDTVEALDELLQFSSNHIVYGYGDQEYDKAYRIKKYLKKILNDDIIDGIHNL